MADIEETIEESVSGPRRVTIGGETVEAHPLPDLIAAQQALAAKVAKTRNHCGFAFRRMEPGGCG